jgi:hypothetical protein
MSFFDSITKKSKLNAAIKKTAEARTSEGSKADQLFKRVYQDYAEVVANEPLLAEALYNWGFALLHQAKTKSGSEAAKLYQDAIAKFSFCMTIDPAYLGAAIDGGVAYMELARVRAAGPHDDLYEMAKSQFGKANTIQAGSASYNLACIYSLRGDKEACLNALENSKDKGFLPDVADILADPDLDDIKRKEWFLAFMDSLTQKPEAAAEKNDEIVAEVAPVNEKTEAFIEVIESREVVVEYTPEYERIEAVAEDVSANEKTETVAENDQIVAEDVSEEELGRVL